MLSELAMSDIADLEASGIRLTPAQIVRLNCLGLRIQRSSRASDVVAAPRVGWAGTVALHEPTVQAETWLETYAARWFEGRDHILARAYACAVAAVPGAFSALTTEQAAVNAVNAWAASLPCTGEQLTVAYEHAVYGDDPDTGVTPAPRAGDKPADPLSSRDLLAAAVDAAVASGLGLSLADIGILTETRLLCILRRYYRNRAGTREEPDTGTAHADYLRTLADIKREASHV